MLTIVLTPNIILYLMVCIYSALSDEDNACYWITLAFYFLMPVLISTSYINFLLFDYLIQMTFLCCLLFLLRKDSIRMLYVSVIFVLTMCQIFAWVLYDYSDSSIAKLLILMPDRFYFEALLTMPITNKDKRKQVIVLSLTCLFLFLLYFY